jgi:hypothetical protein
VSANSSGVAATIPTSRPPSTATSAIAGRRDLVPLRQHVAVFEHRQF